MIENAPVYSWFLKINAARQGLTYCEVVSLDNFQEEGGSILHVFGEQLQQVAIVIEIHENVQFLQLKNTSLPI